MTNTDTVALIGAPTDVGAGRRGAAMAPEALRVAGIAQAIRRLNRKVTDHGNLAGPGNPEQPRTGEYRHLEEVTAWCRLVRDAVAGALESGELPILMGETTAFRSAPLRLSQTTAADARAI